MNRVVKRLLVVLLLTVVFGVIAVFTYLNRVQPSSTGLVATVEQERHPVKVATVAPQTIVERLESTGLLKAERDVMLSAEVGGKVLKVARELGDRCGKGETLVRLDPAGYRIALAQARAGRKQAEIALEHAGRDHARLEKLEAQAAVSSQQLDAADGALKSAAAAVEQARALESAARRSLGETEIRCPFTGFVAQRMAEVGQSVMPGTPLVRLVDTSQLRLALAVTAAELSRIAVGQRVELSDPQLPARRYAGAVARLGVAADERTRTFPVEVLVEEGQDGLRSGQIVRATLELARHVDALAVPGEAIDDQGEQPVVFVVRGGTARATPVTLGPRVDGRAVITGGLAVGDRVVVVGRELLRDGAPVEVVGELGAAASASLEAREPVDAGPGGRP